ncbi:Asparagine--tRNA ligase cytoplasmic 3 [Citrus sinensis]|nr:Asparagine--tRNA ligase cytoplasmic 3 [Citrus sinensis]
MFQVTTLLSEAEKLEKELMKNPPPSEADREAAKLFVKEKGEEHSHTSWHLAEFWMVEPKIAFADLRKPVTVYNYPKGVKAFYMRLNDDLTTVAAMDVVVPKVGELIGGSQREERYGVIKSRIEETGLPIEP